ncbi:MAG: WYL domain-containing protein [Succinivibrionaceae bacterium]|nr:WYL domain-containing protein [Succinivibrionaceae bacterium]
MVKKANTENTKNTLNIDFLNRLCAEGTDGMSYDDICEAFCINKRTAQRWVATVMRLFPNYLMVRRTKRNKFFSVDFTKNTNYSFDFTPSDVSSLKKAIDALDAAPEQLGDDEALVRADLKRLHSKITAADDSSKKKNSYESNTEASLRSTNSAVRFRGPHFEVDDTMVTRLNNFIYSRSVCQIFYRSNNSPDGKLYLVAPIGFLYGNTQYLVAKIVPEALIAELTKDANIVHIEEPDLDIIRGNKGDTPIYKFFKLSNIVTCVDYKKEDSRRPYHRRAPDGSIIGLVQPKKPQAPKNIYFAIDEKETVDNIIYNSFGIFLSKDVYHMKWRFDPYASSHLNNYQFVTPSERQKISKDVEGRITVEFDACGVAEMKWFLDKFGPHVEVLEPANWDEIVAKEMESNDILPV